MTEQPSPFIQALDHWLRCRRVFDDAVSFRLDLKGIDDAEAALRNAGRLLDAALAERLSASAAFEISTPGAVEITAKRDAAEVSVRIPVEPTAATLANMAMRWNHSFGLMTEDHRASLMASMRQLYEEVVSTARRAARRAGRRAAAEHRP